jgi:hypothetical protein
MEVFILKELPLYRLLTFVDNIRELLWNEEDYALAKKYAEKMKKGQVFPPPMVRGWTVDDGCHRIYAMHLAGRRTVEVIDRLRQP